MRISRIFAHGVFGYIHHVNPYLPSGENSQNESSESSLHKKEFLGTVSVTVLELLEGFGY